MKLWTVLFVGAGILVLGIVTGIWSNLFNPTTPTPDQVGPGGHWLPAIKAYSIHSLLHEKIEK